MREGNLLHKMYIIEYYIEQIISSISINKSTLVLSTNSSIRQKKAKTYKHLRQHKYLNATAAKEVKRQAEG